MRVRRTATRENSVATKNPLARTRATTATRESAVLIAGLLTVAGATGPGTRGDPAPRCPGSQDHFSAISGGTRRSAHTSVARALLALGRVQRAPNSLMRWGAADRRRGGALPYEPLPRRSLCQRRVTRHSLTIMMRLTAGA